jgi:hypothetical protein
MRAPPRRWAGRPAGCLIAVSTGPASQRRDLGQRLPVERLVGVVEDDDVVRAAPALDLVRDVGPHLLRGGRIPSIRRSTEARSVARARSGGPRGNQHGGAVGAARGIRILVGPHVHAAIPRALDEADRRRARSPVVRALGLEVRSHHARAGPLAHLDRLAHGVEQRRAGRGRPGSARTTAGRCPRCARARCRRRPRAAVPSPAPRAPRWCSSAPARTRGRPTSRRRPPAAPAAPARASSRSQPRSTAAPHRRP